MGCVESTPVIPPTKQVYYVPQQTATVVSVPNNLPYNYPPAYNPQSLNYTASNNPPPYNPYAQPVNNGYYNQPTYMTTNTVYPQYQPYPQQYPYVQQNNGMSMLGTVGAVAGGVIVGDMVSDIIFD